MGPLGPLRTHEQQHTQSPLEVSRAMQKGQERTNAKINTDLAVLELLQVVAQLDDLAGRRVVVRGAVQLAEQRQRLVQEAAARRKKRRGSREQASDGWGFRSDRENRKKIQDQDTRTTRKGG